MPEPTADHLEIGLLEGLATTRAIRRYRPDPIPDQDLATILFAASRAPSGGNRQPFRFVVLRDGPAAQVARQHLARCFRERWAVDQRAYRYEEAAAGSRGARMGQTMTQFIEHVAEAPVIILVCREGEPGRKWGPDDGASVYPAVQNLFLAARALGYGGVLSLWHSFIAAELHAALGIPAAVRIFATIPLGRPVGHHGPVRRAPLRQLVFEDQWGVVPEWAIDPPGTRFTGG